MTREEEIRQKAISEQRELMESCDWRAGFIAGAKWADETMIKKACNWLLHQEEMIGISFESDFIERFKEAMEE